MIRTAKKTDIDDILKLLVQVNMIHHNGRPDIFKGPVTKFSAEELEVKLEDAENPIFVYEDPTGEKQILGYAFCETKEVKDHALLQDMRALHIEDLCVDEDARDRHVGEALYQYVKEYAKGHGYTSVTLNVWAFNDNAKHFYEKMGMKVRNMTMEDVI